MADPHAHARADLIGRDFAPDASAVDPRWCGDVTYIATGEGCSPSAGLSAHDPDKPFVPHSEPFSTGRLDQVEGASAGIGPGLVFWQDAWSRGYGTSLTASDQGI
ncbi:hypothetical protein [Spongiactinospora rosea]|nr:hypothetical protein [Spongiactinospora rosea]